MSDDELEQQVRAGLRQRAEEARVDDTLVARARAEVRGRRTRWVAVAAAAAVVAAAAGVAVARDPERPTAADPTVAGGEWRTEQWHDVQVQVPADWGYGAAPERSGGSRVTCYPAAYVDAAGEPVDPGGAGAVPYVGRPIRHTDVCVPYPDNRPDAPATDYVWLGAAVEPGVVELPNGLVQETVTAQGTTVTVATTDPVLRERIVSSVSGGERCLAEIGSGGSIAHDAARDLTAPPATLRVCAYARDRETPDGAWRLTYAADLGGEALAAYLAATSTTVAPRDQCPTADYQLTEAVVLELLDADGGVLRQDAVNPLAGCGGVAVGASRVWELETVALTPALVRPWAVGGVPAVLRGDPALGFIGPQG